MLGEEAVSIATPFRIALIFTSQMIARSDSELSDYVPVGIKGNAYVVCSASALGNSF